MITWPPDAPRVPSEGTLLLVTQQHTGKLVWTYASEGVALGFVRDVVRLRSRQDAAQFELRMVVGSTRTTTIAEGEQLVTRALAGRVL